MPAQSRRRLWIALILFLAVLLALPVAVRTIGLLGVPDVPEPVEPGSEDRVPIPAKSNAFGLYREAFEQFETMPTSVFTLFFDWTEWSSMPDEVRPWLQMNGRALELFRAASERPSSFDDRAPGSDVSDRWDDWPEMRGLIFAAELEALRLEEAGDMKEAWKWHRASLRSCCHLGMLGTILERVSGAGLVHISIEGIARWSGQPGVDESMIKVALAEVGEIQKMNVPLSKLIRSEYLTMQKAIIDPDRIRSGNYRLRTDTERFRWEAQRLLWEPEISLRCSKLVYANWLSQCDLPRPTRAPIAPGKLNLFEVSVGGRAGRPAVTAAEIERLLQSAPIFRTLSSERAATTFTAIDRESARQSILKLALILQLWHLCHGEYPDSLEDLVGTEIDEVPRDPFGKGAPILYRREPGTTHSAKVWSIGDDEVDDESRSDLSHRAKRDRDIVVELKRPH